MIIQQRTPGFFDSICYERESGNYFDEKLVNFAEILFNFGQNFYIKDASSLREKKVEVTGGRALKTSKKLIKAIFLIGFIVLFSTTAAFLNPFCAIPLAIPAIFFLVKTYHHRHNFYEPRPQAARPQLQMPAEKRKSNAVESAASDNKNLRTRCTKPISSSKRSNQKALKKIDPKKIDPRGLPNPNKNMCWMNSTMQVVMKVPYLRQAIDTFDQNTFRNEQGESLTEKEKKFILALRNFIDQFDARAKKPILSMQQVEYELYKACYENGIAHRHEHGLESTIQKGIVKLRKELNSIDKNDQDAISAKESAIAEQEKLLKETKRKLDVNYHSGLMQGAAKFFSQDADEFFNFILDVFNIGTRNAFTEKRTIKGTKKATSMCPLAKLIIKLGENKEKKRIDDWINQLFLPVVEEGVEYAFEDGKNENCQSKMEIVPKGLPPEGFTLHVQRHFSKKQKGSFGEEIVDEFNSTAILAKPGDEVDLSAVFGNGSNAKYILTGVILRHEGKNGSRSSSHFTSLFYTENKEIEWRNDEFVSNLAETEKNMKAAYIYIFQKKDALDSVEEKQKKKTPARGDKGKTADTEEFDLFSKPKNIETESPKGKPTARRKKAVARPGK